MQKKLEREKQLADKVQKDLENAKAFNVYDEMEKLKSQNKSLKEIKNEIEDLIF